MGNAWKKSHPAEARAHSYKWRAEHPISHLIIVARCRAKRLGLAFEIYAGDFVDAPLYCPVFGMKLKYYGQAGPNDPASATLDRIDQRKGYVRGNVAIVSFRANNLKGKANPEDLVALARFYGSLDKT